VNEEQRDAFWKDAVEITETRTPVARFRDEWFFYVASDDSYVVTDAVTLEDALRLFGDVTGGESLALYLYRGRELLADYTGVQASPEYETTYHVTKSALPEWLAVLSAE
jgi:hypothetical protein